MPVDPLPVAPDLPVPAADIPGLDLSISFDGFSLFQSGNAHAETGMGTFSFAIASGSDSFAAAGTGVAGTGTVDTAWAFGNDSQALAGNGFLDNAVAADFTGVGGFAEAGGANSDLLGNIDCAFDLGPSPSDSDPGAFAGSVSPDTTGSFDAAGVIDPFGPMGSLAESGDGDFNLGAAIGDGLSSTGATGGNFLLEILPFLPAI
jgi:hypothetical protein